MSEIKRIPFEELEFYAQKLQERGDARSANEALLLSQLVSSLRANAERDLLIANMAARFDQLERSFVNENETQREAYIALVAEFRVMQRRQDDFHQKQELLARIIDTGVDKISEIASKLENMSASVRDVLEP